MPPLPLEGQLGTEKVRPRCGSGYSEYWRQHGVAEMQQGAHSWPGMVSREQYCTTDDFYSERHTHCRASVAAFYRQDFRLLYGGGGGGGGGAGGTGGGRRSGGA